MQKAAISRDHWATQFNDGEFQDVIDHHDFKIDQPVI
jgi:hypothetical protein